MRSIKFDQLERRGQAVPTANVPPATLAAGSLSFRAQDVLDEAAVATSDVQAVKPATGSSSAAKDPAKPPAGSGKS